MLSDLKRMNGVDLLLSMAVVAGSASFVRFLGIAPSPTRTLFVAYALIAAAVVSLMRLGRSPDLAGWLALGLLSMALVGYLTWIPAVGSWISLNLWSEWILSFAFLVFGGVFGVRRWAVWRSLFVALAVVIALLQLVGLLWFQAALEARHGQWGPADFYGSRAIHANLAILMVVGLVCALRHPALSGRSRMAVAVLLSVSVMISQWRTVWLAMFAALAVLTLEALRHPRSHGVGPSTLAAAAASAAFLILPALTGVSLLPGSSVSSVGSVALPSSATSNETLTWRIEMWQSRLEAPRSIKGVLSGGALAPDNVVFPGTGIMNGSMSAHNAFLDVYVATGLLGLTLVLVLIGLALARGGLDQDEIGVSLIAALVFGMTFFWPPWLWVIIGAALSRPPRTGKASRLPTADLVAESP